MSKTDMLGRIVVLLGGRVAEAVALGDIATGASNDIERATEIARDMVTRYGMSQKLGPVSYASGEHEVFLGKDYGNMKNYSEAIAADIDEEVKSIITNAYNECESIITTHRDKLTAVAEYLIEKEKTDGKTFESIMAGTFEAAANDKDSDSEKTDNADSQAEEE